MTLEADNAPEAEVESTSADAEANPAEELVSTQADASETQAEEPESNKSTSAVAGAEGVPDKLQALIDSKYGGDRQKFMDGLYEQWNSSSALRGEIKELKGFIEEIREQTLASRVPEPVAIIEDADYQALQSNIGVLDKDLEANEVARQGFIKSFNKLEGEIAELRGQAKLADEFNRFEIIRQIEARETKKENLNSKWDNSFREDRAIQREKNSLSKELKQLEKALSESRAKQKQSQEEDLEYQANFRAAFDGLVAEAAAARGIAEGSKIREHLLQTIKAEAIVYLQQVSPELPDDFVKQRTDAYFEVQGLAKKANFGAQGKQPLLQKGLPSAAGVSRPASSPSVPPKKMTVEQARAWITKKGAELDARHSVKK